MRRRHWFCILAPATAVCIAASSLAQQSPTPFRSIYDTMTRETACRRTLATFANSGLLDALKTDGPYTLLAPADEAFGKLSPEATRKLNDNRERAMQNFSYHIVKGRLTAAEIAAAGRLETLQGREIQVQSKSGEALLNGSARIVQADIGCKNGMIHIIDEVLFPLRRPRIVKETPLHEAAWFRTLVFLIVSCSIAAVIYRHAKKPKKRPVRPGDEQDKLRPKKKRRSPAV